MQPMLGIRGLLSGWLLALAIGGLSCGGDEPLSCDNFSDCGGDPVGTWEIANSCAANGSPVALDAFCLGATLTVNNPVLTGNMTFGPGGAYTTTARLGADLALGFPLTCVADALKGEGAPMVPAFGLSCPAVGFAVNLFLASGGLSNAAPGVDLSLIANNIESANCVGTTVCACTIVVKDLPMLDQGQYSVVGETLNLQSNTLGPSQAAHCRKGKRLGVRIQLANAALPVLPEATVIMNKR